MKEIIVDKIEESSKGAIHYQDYIELALYHPTNGYYSKEQLKIGKQGDFYTTSNISSVYGKIMADYFLECIRMNSYSPVVYEFGGGNGRFAKTVIDYFIQNDMHDFTYKVIESSPFHRRLQDEQLKDYKQVEFLSSLDDLDEINGIVFSNELFDAFPVRIVEKFQGEMFEIWVTLEEDTLSECYFPLDDSAINTYLEKHGIVLENGQRYEVPLSVEEFIRGIARKMGRCTVITVDYGYTKEELGQPHLREGSLRGYYKHQQYENVLMYPGEMDITYHIHLDEYIQSCEEQGIKTEKVMKQKEFLLNRNLLDYLQQHEANDPFSKEYRHNRGILSLLADGGISDHFTIVIQKRG